MRYPSPVNRDQILHAAAARASRLGEGLIARHITDRLLNRR